MNRSSDFALVAALIVAVGSPPAFAVCRRVFLALLLAPLFTALSAALSCVLMLIFGGGLLGWFAAVALVQTGLSAWWILAGKRVPMPVGGFVDVLLLAVPTAPPFLMALNGPVMWDARKIWWLHAAYFSQGAEYARYAIGNPQIVAKAHTDYPPALSAAVALAWSIVSGNDFYLAQFVSAMLTFSAVAAFAYAVRVATSGAPATLSRLAAACSTVVVWIFDYPLVTAGYSDTLWAATFAAAVVILFYGPPGSVRSVLPGVLLTVAALSKNEGLIAVIGLAVVLLVRHRGRVRQMPGVLAAIAAGLAWSVVARALGAVSDLAGPGVWDRLTNVGQVFTRIGLVLKSAWNLFGPTAAPVVLAVVLLGNLLLRRQRRQLGLGADGWVWATVLLYFAALVGTYVLTPYDIEWHLQTSISRVMVAAVLLAFASTICWVVVALAGSAPSREPTGEQVHEPPAQPAPVGARGAWEKVNDQG